MKNPLSVYLQDHLAGAVFGVELVEALSQDTTSPGLAAEAAHWEREIKADQATLRGILDRLDASPGTVKEVISWIAEKATSLKLRRQSHSKLGTLETLETLALGILGKQKLWISLETAAAGEVRLSGIDFRSLQERARVQHEAVEKRRRDFAAEVFSPAALAH